MHPFKAILTVLLICPLLSYAQVQIGTDIDGESIFDESGRALALSADGNRVAIGAPGNTGVNGEYAGHARIYENQNGDWVQLGSDIDGDNPSNYLGSSVALSADANFVAVGATHLTVDGIGAAGQVKVFQYQNDDWEQIGDDILGGPVSELTGWNVALSGSGDIVAVASPHYHLPNQIAARGRIRVYQNQMGAWAKLGDDIIADGSEDLLGRGMDISFDGRILAVGAPSSGNSTLDASGYVKIYKFESGNWAQIGDDIEGDIDGDEFGFAVSISSDGNTVVSGSRYNDVNGDNTGVVKIFENQAGTWVQKGNSIYGDQTNSWFSQSLSISANGNIVSIGARSHNNSNGTAAGLVRIYGYQGGAWSQLGADIIGETELDQSGYSQALSGDGTRVAIGAPKNNDNAAAAGHVRVYDMSTFVTTTTEITLDNSSLYPNPARDLVHVDFFGDEILRRIDIFNQLGQFIKSEFNASFSVKDLSAGFYTLQIESNKGKSTKKLLVR